MRKYLYIPLLAIVFCSCASSRSTAGKQQPVPTPVPVAKEAPRQVPPTQNTDAQSTYDRQVK